MNKPEPGSLCKATSPIYRKYAELAERLVPPAGFAPTTRGELLAAASFIYAAVHEDGLTLVVSPLLERVAIVGSLLRRYDWAQGEVHQHVWAAWNRFVDALDAYLTALHEHADMDEPPALLPLRSCPAAHDLEFVMHAVIAVVSTLDEKACPAQEVGTRNDVAAVRFIRDVAESKFSLPHLTTEEILAAVTTHAKQIMQNA